MRRDTDILERLKEQSEWYSDGFGPLCAEAAAEIEMLRGRLRHYSREADPGRSAWLNADGTSALYNHLKNRQIPIQTRLDRLKHGGFNRMGWRKIKRKAA